jgi:hypothetical protein
MSKPRSDGDELIAEVMRRLAVAAEKRDECRSEIIRGVQAVEARKKWNERNGQAGQIKRKAARLRATLAKAETLSKEIESFFSAVLDDMVGYDVSRNYEAFKICLSDGIAAAQGIERQLVVKKGKKPKNYDRYAAKTLAVDLVNSTPAAFNKAVQNSVASLLYELLTGDADVDIPESADEHRPSLLQTRGRIKPQR